MLDYSLGIVKDNIPNQKYSRIILKFPDIVSFRHVQPSAAIVLYF